MLPIPICNLKHGESDAEMAGNQCLPCICLSVSQLLSQNKANCSLSVFDKENSIKFLLDSVHYLYMKSTPNPSFYPMLPYESLSSHASIDKKIKEMKMKMKNNNQKLKEMKKKRNINIDLAILPSHDNISVIADV